MMRGEIISSAVICFLRVRFMLAMIFFGL
jgi:hypothetical protein